MKRSFLLASILCASSITVTMSACGESSSSTDVDRCQSGRCDDLDLPDSEIEDTPCDGVLLDRSGRNHRKVAGRLNDPLATKVLRVGDTCPTTFQDIMAKLRTTDTENCDPADPQSGIATRLVSETAQITGEPTNYRAVTSRQCGDRGTHGLLFSLFGVDADAQSLPQNVEIIAFDESAGVFNFYEAEPGGGLTFFGNSKDMLLGADGQTRRCAACHGAGGLVMKELETPWLHWEGHMDTPGATELIERFDDLGKRETGREFERVVKQGNGNWNQTRAKHLLETASTKELLRPLFCTIEVNLDNGADFESPANGATEGSFMTRIPGDSLMHPLLVPGVSLTFPPTPNGVPINPTDYELLIKANNQRVPGIPGAVDTVFDYPFVERSQIDSGYATQLLVANAVDTDFMEDVLMVDYTRPLFSEDRCGLLEFAPSIPTAQLTADALRDGFIQNLLGAGAGTPAAELLANLTNTEQEHRVTTQAFMDACEARTDKHVLNEGTAEETTIAGSLVDFVAINSMNRRIATGLKVFEFPQTMPTDDLNLPFGSRLNPVDCTLTNEFVAIAEPGVLPDPDPEPEPATCGHELCETGPTLDPNCDSCAAQICDVDPFCCATEWDSLCVGQVESVCNQTCE